MADKIIIRKEINIKKIIYILSAIIIIPVIFYIIIFYRLYLVKINGIEELIRQKEYTQADELILASFFSYNFDKKLFKTLSRNNYTASLESSNRYQTMSAISSMKKYISFFSAVDPEIFYWLGTSFYSLGPPYYKEAARYYEKYASLEKKDKDRILDSYMKLFDVYNVLAEFDNSEHFLKKAITLNSSDPYLLLELSDIYGRKGEKIRSRELLEKIISQNKDAYSPMVEAACLRLISLLKDFRLHEEVVFYFDYILHHSPTNINIMIDYGVYMLGVNRKTQAKKIFRRARMLDWYNKKVKHYLKYF
ncbi:tetratricopeptide repeat protein [Spirochaetota bacterium]